MAEPGTRNHTVSRTPSGATRPPRLRCFTGCAERHDRPAAVLQLRAVKLVIAIVRPERANDVLEALYRADVRGLSMTRVQGHGGEIDRVETYRGTTVKMELSEKVRFEIGVSDHFVEPTVQAIIEGARTGEVGDGKIFVLPRRAGRPHPHRRARRRRRHARGACVILAAAAADAAPIDTGDTAWMLMATALVLLMTPALGLFYAGLVRSKNTLNTFMMSIAALGAVTIAWAFVAYSLAFSGHGLHRRLRQRVPARRRADVDARPDDPRPALLRLPGDVLHHHRRADLGRRRRADAVPAVHGLHGRSGPASSTRRWRTGSGAAAGSPQHGTLDWAGGVPVEMASGFSAFAAAIVVGARKDYGRQAVLPHNSVYVLVGAGPALVRLVRLQRRQRPERLGRDALVHEHAARAGRDARRLDRARLRARREGDGDRRRDGDHRRLRPDHAGRRLHQPDVGDPARRARRRSRATSSSSSGPRHAPRRDARRARRARDQRLRRDPLHRLLRAARAGTGSAATACFFGDAGQLWDQAQAVARRAGLRVRRDVRPAAADRRSSCRCA